MKKFNLLILSLIWTSLIYADGQTCYPSNLSVGGQVSYMRLDLREANSPAILGSDSGAHLGGTLGGAQAVFEYKDMGSLYTGILANFLTGCVSDRRSQNFPDRTIWDVEAEGRFGYNYQGLQGKKMEVTPFIGFGFTYFLSDRDSSLDISSRAFDYYKFYLPVGFLLNYAFFDWFNMGFNFKWFPDIDSTMRISLFKNARWVLFKKNDQLHVEVPFVFRFGEDKLPFLSFVFFWKRKKDGGTKTNVLGDAVVGIPAQTHTYWGGSANLGYRF